MSLVELANAPTPSRRPAFGVMSEAQLGGRPGRPSARREGGVMTNGCLTSCTRVSVSYLANAGKLGIA